MTTSEEKLKPATIPEKSSRLLLIAAWFALLTGLGKLLFGVFRSSSCTNSRL
jgi:hypothetical protein